MKNPPGGNAHEQGVREPSLKGSVHWQGWDSKRGVGWGGKAWGSFFLGCCNFEGGDCPGLEVRVDENGEMVPWQELREKGSWEWGWES